MKPLITFSHGESPYERPDDPYRCGLAAEDRPCPLGPTGGGACPAVECRPRPDPATGQLGCGRPLAHGGRCQEGPGPQGQCGRKVGPCAPLLQHRAARGLVTRGAILLVLGLLLAVLATPSWRRRLLDPGPLSSHHAVLQGRCVACHATDLSPTRWLVAAITPDRAAHDAQRCQGCHALAEHALEPHGLSPAELARLTSLAAPASEVPSPLSLAARLPAPSVAALTSLTLGCGRCHPEHRGRAASLVPASDDQCRTCHTARFESLAHGHPEFRDFGYRRPVGIRFDHASHADASDPKRLLGREGVSLEASCLRCHRPDARGQHMRVRDFAEACGSCHGADVDGRPGAAEPEAGLSWSVLSFPRLPAALLEGAGPWPAAADEGQDPGLSDLTRLLLAGDPTLPRDLSELPVPKAATGLLHRCPRDPTHPAQQIAAGAEDWELECAACAEEGVTTRQVPDVPPVLRRLAPALQRLLRELRLAAGGEPLAREALAQRLSRLAGRAVNGAAVDEWLAALPAPVLTEAARRWGLLGEDPAAGPATLRTDWQPGPLDAQGRWWLTPDARLEYRSSGHRDPLARAFLDLAGACAPDAPALAALQRVFASSCTKCHELEVAPGRAPVVHWTALHAQKRMRGLTQFSHRPHDQLPEVAQGCVSCHRPRWTAAEEERQRARSRGEGSFLLLAGFDSRAGCSSCHAPERVEDGCLTCHTYHAVPPTLTRSAVDAGAGD